MLLSLTISRDRHQISEERGLRRCGVPAFRCLARELPGSLGMRALSASVLLAALLGFSIGCGSITKGALDGVGDSAGGGAGGHAGSAAGQGGRGGGAAGASGTSGGAAGTGGGTAGASGTSGGVAGGAGAGGTTGPACGPVQCGAGMVCCNALCGICTPPGGGCVAACPAGGSGGGAGTGGGSGRGGNTGRGGAAAGASGHGGSAGAAGSSSGGSGGAAGKAGAGGSASGGTAGAASHGECTQASDCVLHDDCCTCASVPKNNLGATCNIACIADLCGSRGITSADVACVAGRCALDLSCNPRTVTCRVAPPVCPAGSLQVVAGNCYAGSCLPAAQCSDVGSCDACTAAGLSCVTDQVLGGPRFHCVTVPSACSGAPTCQCLGVCVGAFQCTDPASTTLTCQCPVC